MIEKISDIKPGEYFSVESADGGIVKAPCTRRVLAVGSKTVASDSFNDRGYHYKLKMENYIETIKNADGVNLHKFSK